MTKTLEVSGKTEDKAIEAALEQLGLERDDVTVEIVERAKSGFLGLGSSLAVVRVSYEVTESTEDKAREFLEGLLERMGTAAEIECSPREKDGLNICLSGENMGMIIGRRGETLDAIQHLTNYTVNRSAEKRTYISIDAENYRKKREESLIRLAEKMAGKVLKYRRNMALEPMNSYERHIIHTALQDFEGVSTSSTGNEPNRRVVVIYEGDDTSAASSPSKMVREWS